MHVTVGPGGKRHQGCSAPAGRTVAAGRTGGPPLIIASVGVPT